MSLLVRKSCIFPVAMLIMLLSACSSLRMRSHAEESQIVRIIVAHERRCVGSWISPGTLLTASHCVPSDTMHVQIQKGSADLPVGLDVTEAQRHESADIVILKFSQFPLKGDFLTIAGWSGNVNAELVVPIARGNSTKIVKLGHIQLDGPVLRARPTRGCLHQGDSGTPMLETSGARRTIVGILISGSVSCRGRQTFLHLDPLANWISDND